MRFADGGDIICSFKKFFVLYKLMIVGICTWDVHGSKVDLGKMEREEG